MKSILLLLVSIVLSSNSFAVVLTSGDITLCPSIRCEQPEIIPSPGPSEIVTDYNIFVDGNLYLDYSITTSDTENNTIFEDAELISFTAGSGISILEFDDSPPQPNPNNLQIIVDPDFDLNLTGDLLLFSSIPFTSASFEATQSIYIGDYSNFTPVPIPGALWLFATSIIGLATRSRKKPINIKI